MADEQYVAFRVSQQEYAIAISQVREIILYQKATKLPNTASYLEGIINLRGKIIPVIDLAVRFDLKAKGSSERKAIIIEDDGLNVGVIVDDVTEVLRISEAEMENAPAVQGCRNEHIKGIGKKEGRLLIILEAATLFDGQEIGDLYNAG